MSQAVTDLADEPSSLLEWATRLAADPQLRARLAADPRGLLGEQGFAHVLPADLHHALPLVTDGVAARLGHDVDGDVTGSVDAQRAGEHPIDALARQFIHVSDAVLAGPSSEEVEHDLDDLDGHVAPGSHDPTAALDDLTGLHDLDAHDVGAHIHGLPGHEDHQAFGSVVPTVSSATHGPEPGPAVGNADGPDRADDAQVHHLDDHPALDHPALDHPDTYSAHDADVAHAEPADGHLTHDLLDL